VTAQEIQSLIEAGVPDVKVFVEGEDGVHFSAIVISPAFAGLGMVKRHQWVYQSLGDRMQSEIHALSIKTLTPQEYHKASHG
jgi:acid stress-induced BolA-like protein IbaG/YrbA